MSRQLALLVALGCFAALSGCASARYISSDPNGGVVAIPSNTNAWPTHYRAAAEELMRQKCPDGYVIDHEGEVVTGTTHTTQTNTQKNPASLDEQSSQTVSSSNSTEWRIWFHRKGVQPSRPPTPLSVPTVRLPKRGELPPEPVPVAVGN